MNIETLQKILAGESDALSPNYGCNILNDVYYTALEYNVAYTCVPSCPEPPLKSWLNRFSATSAKPSWREFWQNMQKCSNMQECTLKIQPSSKHEFNSNGKYLSVSTPKRLIVLKTNSTVCIQLSELGYTHNTKQFVPFGDDEAYFNKYIGFIRWF